MRTRVGKLIYDVTAGRDAVARRPLITVSILSFGYFDLLCVIKNDRAYQGYGTGGVRKMYKAFECNSDSVNVAFY